MTTSIDNFTLRDALIARCFQDITSEDRSTKSWRLKHPDMAHWVSVKRAEVPSRRMATFPLVIHPDDARRLESIASASSGVFISSDPYKGISTKYDGVLGRSIALESESALDELLSLLMPVSVVDSLLLAAAAVEIDAGLAGRPVLPTTRTALIEARAGQGKDQKELLNIWGYQCAVSGCAIETALIASHAVPWRDNKDPDVCLNPYNGLLSAASIDRLFDQGLIGFDDDGFLLCKPSIVSAELEKVGLTTSSSLRSVPPQTRPYLAEHRKRFGF